MKRKIGPLPLWAWVLIAGGTVGIVWYLRSGSSSSSSGAPVDGSLPATGAAPGDALGSGGGGSDLAPAAPFTGTATTDDIYGALLGPSGQISAQGLTDGGADSPLQTWGGEVNDVAEGIGALQKVFPGMFATPATAAATKPKVNTVVRPSAAHGGAPWEYRIGSGGRLIPVKAAAKTVTTAKKTAKKATTTTAKKKTTTKSHGSGEAGKTASKDHAKTATQRTTKQIATDSAHQGKPKVKTPAKSTHVHSSGNSQKHRTTSRKRGH